MMESHISGRMRAARYQPNVTLDTAGANASPRSATTVMMEPLTTKNRSTPTAPADSPPHQIVRPEYLGSATIPSAWSMTTANAQKPRIYYMPGIAGRAAARYARVEHRGSVRASRRVLTSSSSCATACLIGREPAT